MLHLLPLVLVLQLSSLIEAYLKTHKNRCKTSPSPHTNDIGELLVADFDAGAGPNECHLSGGDSGGGVFIKDGSEWKLAGISYAVDGPYNWTGSGGGFNAAIFDGGGLYVADNGNWVPILPLPTPQPGSFYCTRISARVDWINSVLSTPITDDSPTVQSAPTPSGTYADVAAAVNEQSKTITLPQPPVTEFYRLRSCGGNLRISSIRLQNGNLVFTYE